MSFFKRKEEKKSELPELPEMPGLPELPELPKKNAQPLPVFPTNQIGESIGLTTIKNSINEANSEKSASPIAEKRTIEIPDISKASEFTKSYSAMKEPVFIKLDKFQDAVKKFEEIKMKVSDIQNSLEKLRDIKDKEEIELKSWEEEMQSIKDRVNLIDNSLFNKI
jgi:flagellar motility protein MotE (MotC chaperone)